MVTVFFFLFSFELFLKVLQDMLLLFLPVSVVNLRESLVLIVLHFQLLNRIFLKLLNLNQTEASSPIAWSIDCLPTSRGGGGRISTTLLFNVSSFPNKTFENRWQSCFFSGGVDITTGSSLPARRYDWRHRDSRRGGLLSSSLRHVYSDLFIRKQAEGNTTRSGDQWYVTISFLAL